MKHTLFPEMDKEIAEGRLAERREARQRAREYLRGKEGHEKWIIKTLTEKGPQLDASMFFELSELCDTGGASGGFKQGMPVFAVAHAMWLTGKLWRREFPDHPSGEKAFTYGIKGVHSIPTRQAVFRANGQVKNQEEV